MRCKHVDDVSLHTYIHKYSDFLVAMISVGLAQARPNKVWFMHEYNYNIYGYDIIIIITIYYYYSIMMINNEYNSNFYTH